MSRFTEQHRLLAGLGVLLALGFAAAAGVAWFSGRDAIRRDFATQVLPAAADGLQAEIRAILARPVPASALLAQDSALRAGLTAADGNPEAIQRALKDFTQKADAATGFVVSERTRQQYNADGAGKPVQESEARDQWYFKLREGKEPYRIRAEPESNSLFVHHRIVDDSGAFIGATGIAVKLDSVTRVLERYQARLQGSVYLIDGNGVAVLSGKPAPQPNALRERAGIREFAAEILGLPTESPGIPLEYLQNQTPVLVHVRPVPQLGWRLVVERNIGPELTALQPRLLWIASAGAGVMLAVLGLVLLAGRRHEAQLARLSSIDPLTGLMNRPAFEIILRQSMRDFERNGKPLSAILFDIDAFKTINGSHGNQSGDQVLQTVAKLAQGVVRDNDILTRWGSEEFLILLRDCELEFAARLADKLRDAIAQHDFNLPKQVTASVGVAQYVLQEPEARFFARADQARYEAKATGRNRTIVSVMEGQEAQDQVMVKRA
jgi:diguanylate cyclase (GGDEF)-like protein